MTDKLDKRGMILAALSKWVAQRPGLDYHNYGDARSYRSEMRSITKDRHAAERLLSAVGWRSSIGEQELRAAFKSAYSGRLSLVDREDGSIALDYCTGQYWPTEYRRAACAVLASALWAYARANLPEDAERPGDKLRDYFRREFGRPLAQTWFS
jgi:hypothetical protein